MKPAITLVLLLATITSIAQKRDTLFIKSDQTLVSTKDSADFIRILTQPDPSRKAYLVTDFYKSGKRKLEGIAISDEPVTFNGEVISYFENGNQKTLNKYRNGPLVGQQLEFFPNGKLSVVENHVSFQEKPYPANISIISNYDSLGTALVTNGDGYFKRYDETFKIIAEEGSVKSGQRDGEWKLIQGDLSFLEIYNSGKLISGTSTNKNGEVKKYTEVETLPSFPGGINEFGKHLGKSIRYPADERQKRIEGKVVVLFVVEKDGSIGNVKVIRSVTPGLDAEAIKSVKQMPKWVPGMQRGVPVRATYTVPINFSLGF